MKFAIHTEAELQRHPIDTVVLWGNVRKTINPASIEEMADSILEHGIIQPPLARMRDGVPQLYAGQRRYWGLVRAIAKAEENAANESLPENERENYKQRLAALQNIPLLVQELDDATIKERQIVENLQREDVSPKEEAEGYAELLAMTTESGEKLYTMERLAETVGKNFRYISQRLGLRNAPEKLWTAYEEKKIGTRHLELIGRIPTPKNREEAAKMLLEPKYRSTPLTVEETVEMIQENFRVSLRSSAFQLDDAGLLPTEWDAGIRIKGGACTDCPHRTENMKDLEGELMPTGGKGRGNKAGIDRLLCCNPGCFSEKNNILWRTTKAAAERENRRVMDVDQSSKIFSQYGGGLNHGTGYVDLGEAPGYEEIGHYNGDELPKWDKLLTGTGAKSQAVMARHPKTKRVHFLLERDKAVELAEGNGHKEIFAQRPKPAKREKPQSKEDAAKEEEARRKGRLTDEVTEKLFVEAVHESLRLTKIFDAAMVEVAFEKFLETIFDYEAPDVMNKMLELPENTKVEGVREALMKKVREDLKADPAAAMRWFLYVIAVREVDCSYGEEVLNGELAKVLVKRLGIDTKAIKKQASGLIDAAMDREAAAKELAELEKRGKAEFTAKDVLELYKKGAMPKRATVEIVLHVLARGDGQEKLGDQVAWIEQKAKEHYPKVKGSTELSDTQLVELVSKLIPSDKEEAKAPAKKVAAEPAKKALAKKASAKKAAKKAAAKKAKKAKA